MISPKNDNIETAHYFSLEELQIISLLRFPLRLDRDGKNYYGENFFGSKGIKKDNRTIEKYFCAEYDILRNKKLFKLMRK